MAWQRFMHYFKFDHGAQVSFQVSAQQAIPLGLTGELCFFDNNGTRIIMRADPNHAPLLGMVKKQIVQERSLIRGYFSAQELDETSRPMDKNSILSKKFLTPKLKIEYELQG